MYPVNDPVGFDRLMFSHHDLQVRVTLTNLNGKPLSNLTPYFVDGQVSVDTSAETSRALDLTLFDPQRKIYLDPGAPSAFGIFLANMIKIDYVIINPQGTQSYSVPVFFGPIDDVSRDETYLKITGLGKESLALNNSWVAKVYKKGAKKTDVIRDILVKLMGENLISIPNKADKLTADLKVTREKSPWSVAKSIARSLGMVLFYNAAGVATLMKASGTSRFLFDANRITSKPTVDYDLSQTINAVQVKGKKPKKKKRAVTYTVYAPSGHPLSPHSLGRNGAPRYLWQTIENDKLATKAACKTVALANLNTGLLLGVDSQFNGFPNPRLAEYDVVTLRASGINLNFVLTKFTIPLVAGVDASYGYLARNRLRMNPKKAAQSSQTAGGKKKKGQRFKTAPGVKLANTKKK